MLKETQAVNHAGRQEKRLRVSLASSLIKLIADLFQLQLLKIRHGLRKPHTDTS